jgi:hypothetical protein
MNYILGKQEGKSGRVIFPSLVRTVDCRMLVVNNELHFGKAGRKTRSSCFRRGCPERSGMPLWSLPPSEISGPKICSDIDITSLESAQRIVVPPNLSTAIRKVPAGIHCALEMCGMPMVWRTWRNSPLVTSHMVHCPSLHPTKTTLASEGCVAMWLQVPRKESIGWMSWSWHDSQTRMTDGEMPPTFDSSQVHCPFENLIGPEFPRADSRSSWSQRLDIQHQTCIARS